MPQALEKTRRFQERLYEERISEDWDAVIPVIGEEGVGKSTYILWWTWDWKRVRDVEPAAENVLNTIIWEDRQAFKKALVEYPNQSVVPVMDAHRILFAKEAMESAQKEIEHDMLDMRIGERVILLGYQSWNDMPTILRRRRAKFAFHIPTRGTVHGYNRSSLDEMHENGGEEWPKPDFSDRFPSLEGTDLWAEFERRDEEHKVERMMNDDGEEEEEITLEEVVDTILDRGVDHVVSENQATGQRTVDADMIRYHYDLSIRDARSVKKVVASKVDLSETDPEEVAT